MKNLVVISISIILFYSCQGINDSGENDDYKVLGLEDIRNEYRIVDSLNFLSFQNKLDIKKSDRYVILGIDSRNDLLLIRQCDEQRLFGCLMYNNVFGLFYDDCDSSWCEENEGITVIDHEGYAGFPNFIGCSPDTSL